jgi:hypothetical protein
VCDEVTRRCVGCLANDDCTATGICDTLRKVCVECDARDACRTPLTYCDGGVCKPLRTWRRATVRLRNKAAMCLCAFGGGNKCPTTPCEGAGRDMCQWGPWRLAVRREGGDQKNVCVDDNGAGKGGLPTCGGEWDSRCLWTMERLDTADPAAFVVRLRLRDAPDHCAWVSKDYDDGKRRGSQFRGWVMHNQCTSRNSEFLVRDVRPPTGASDMILARGTEFKLQPQNGDNANLGLMPTSDPWPWWTHRGAPEDTWVVDDIRDVQWS